ncbi:MAG: hypothetical protein ABEI75_01505 [Halobaculum sp.]
MTDGGLRESYRSGRRIQRNETQYDGPWLRGVYLPAILLTALVALLPTVAVYLAVAAVVPTNRVATVAVGVMLPVGWVVYHTVVALLVEESHSDR